MGDREREGEREGEKEGEKERERRREIERPWRNDPLSAYTPGGPADPSDRLFTHK